MSFTLGLVLGGAVGVILERLLGRPLDSLVIDRLRNRLHRWRLRRIGREGLTSGQYIVVRDAAHFVHHYVPAGLGAADLVARVRSGSDSLDSRLAQSPVSDLLPAQVELQTSIENWRSALDADPRAWNGRSLALTHVDAGRRPTTEEPTLTLTFRETDYATHLAVSDAWEAIPIEQRRAQNSADHLREVDPLLSNSFGLNATIETADGFTIITRRSRLTRGWHGRWHIAFNEGLSDIDRVPSGAVDLTQAFARGLREELGIEASLIPNFGTRMSVHTLLVNVDAYQWGLLGHLDLRRTDLTSTAIQLGRTLGAAHDGWEADELRFVEFARSPDAAIRELESDEPWVPHGLLNLGLSTIQRHPSSAGRVRQALAAHQSI